ncbi:YgaP family membrane protein [Polynucleobacter sinensis]|jgi:hypothetical protein|uniref:YgaP family membrane protein n=1 Tax=Polynucleobacter sinensis TaxID=1743157 RepID=UPI0009EF6CC2|nr:DUF2892 domain-containing protein [Polynucleobacter sinensis]
MSLSKMHAQRYNVGHLDRLLRILVGIDLMGLADMHWIDFWGWVGVIPLLTGILRYCPLYALLHINTYRDAGYVK